MRLWMIFVVGCSLLCLCGCEELFLPGKWAVRQGVEGAEKVGLKQHTQYWHLNCPWCGAECYNSKEYGMKPMTRQEHIAWARQVGYVAENGYVYCSVRCRDAASTVSGANEVIVPRN